jgi:RNA polymerase sigma-70 factor (ECF subfamily)
VADSTLEDLMQEYVDGKAIAFEEIYRRVSPSLLAFLLRLTRDRPRAEDLLQVTFVKVHRARSSYLLGAPLLPWLLAIARRTFLDERRMTKSRYEDLSRDGKMPEHSEPPDTINDEVSDVLARALDDLPDNYREAIQLTKITGLSLSEAADVLDTTPTAVKLRVHRGYNLMRDKIEVLRRLRT